MALLENINSPADIKQMSIEELNTLCAELREYIIDTVSKTGGHLASSLGTVELSVALHKVFDTPNDKIVWDVGHQAYAHKILTGRRDAFKTLRTLDGISGFPKRCESEYDTFDTGHSSTSISAALGMARARDIKGEKNSVVAVFGDGALTGGMMYEAMNDAGRSKTPIIMILNDNNMSISNNVGAISSHLKKLRSDPQYFESKKIIERHLSRIPLLGKRLVNAIKRIKRVVHRSIVPDPLFQSFGFKYIGPLDGHDLTSLIAFLKYAKGLHESVVIHICTKKGKGYAFAEKNPSAYHGVSKFDKVIGVEPKTETDYSAVFGYTLCELAEDDDNICAITCAMPSGTGLNAFAGEFPKRFFDVGIAEQHGVTLAAGLACGGMVPVIAVYSTFLQRAYDQILHDVCLQNLHVVFGVDRAGVVGADGETHQGLFDISYLSSMPNMRVLSPANKHQLSQMLAYAVKDCDGPVAIRYPRGNTECSACTGTKYDHLESIHFGEKVCIVATGRMMATAEAVYNALGQNISVCALPCIKPLPIDDIKEMASRHELVITIEDNVKTGGIGEMIASCILENNIQTKVKIFAYPTKPIEHGSIEELDKRYGIDAASIKSEIEALGIR